MKYICLTLIAALAITSSSLMGYESCSEYNKRNDITGYNACESRNSSETNNKIERESERKRKESDDFVDRVRRVNAESDEKKFREEQLNLQRQQLEISKSNSIKPTCDDTAAFQAIHDLVVLFQKPINKLFKKYVSSGNCAAASELGEAVVSSYLLEVVSNAKATGRQLDPEVMQIPTGDVLEYITKCEKQQTKQKKE